MENNKKDNAQEVGEIGEIRVGYPYTCFMVGDNWFRYRMKEILENKGVLHIVNDER